MITVVNKKTHSPTPNDIYIGRGSVLGNKFTSIPLKNTKAEVQCKSREESIEKYKDWLIEEINSGNKQIRIMMNTIYKLAKKEDVNLVCYCKPLSCHGDVIKEIIEKEL